MKEKAGAIVKRGGVKSKKMIGKLGGPKKTLRINKAFKEDALSGDGTQSMYETHCCFITIY